MTGNRQPLNLGKVYETPMTTLRDQKRIVEFFALLQDEIRRKCNNNLDPIPFKISEMRNVHEISLEPIYEQHIDCIRNVISSLNTDIPGIREALLEWLA